MLVASIDNKINSVSEADVTFTKQKVVATAGCTGAKTAVAKAKG